MKIFHTNILRKWRKLYAVFSMHKPKKIIKKSKIRNHQIWIERYYVSDQRKFFICAQGKGYTIWKRVSDDPYYAKETFFHYRLFVWILDIFNWHPSTKLICRIMDKLI